MPSVRGRVSRLTLSLYASVRGRVSRLIFRVQTSNNFLTATSSTVYEDR